MINNIVSFASDGGWCRRWWTIAVSTFVITKTCWLILGSWGIYSSTDKLLAERRGQNKHQDNAQNRDPIDSQVDQSGTSDEKTEGDGLEHRQYVISHGRWFKNVSYPHYFTEILIYIFLFSVYCNIVLRMMYTALILRVLVHAGGGVAGGGGVGGSIHSHRPI